MREDAELANEAREAMESWRNYFAHNITQYHEYYEFVKGQQWNDEETKLLKTYKKVPLSMNKLGTLVKTLQGEQRQNTPNLEINPDSNADQQSAKIREALIKHISFESRTKIHYQTAFAQDAIGGFSALLLTSDYETNYSFDQDVFVESFVDPTKTFFDVGARHLNKEDGMHCGYSNFIDRRKFKAVYGEDAEREIGDVSSENTTFTWSNEDGITVIDFFKKQYKSIMLYLLSNGQIIDADEYGELEKQEIEGGEFLFHEGEVVRVENERKAPRYKITHYKIAGDFILEETEVPLEQLPMVFLSSDSWYNEQGQQMCVPFVADAKDAQKYINYLATQSAYLLKNSRYDQFLVSKENVRGRDTKQIWDDPASQNGALYFDKDKDGHIPQQLDVPELPQSLSVEYQRAMNDIYTSTGMYAARLGDQSNEYSGKAIDARTRQGSYSTYVNFDALNIAIATLAQGINEMIPHIYDTERVISLMLPDEGIKQITLNQQMDDYGQMIANDVTKGTYTVKLQPGPSFEGQKQEALESLQTVLQANPQAFPLIADLYAENLPLANNIELRNRLKTLVPPEILQAEETGQPIQQQDQGPSPEEQQQQMEAQIKQAELQLKQKDLELKEQELQLKAQKETAETQMEMEKLEQERLEIAAQLEEQQLRYDAEMHRTRTDQEIARANNLTDILTHSPK